MSRERKLERPGPVHFEAIRWLKMHAPGHRNARPHRELVAHLKKWCNDCGITFASEYARNAEERGSGDFDREVRALVKECLALGYPCLYSGRGYFYAPPDDVEGYRLCREQIRSRMKALHRVAKRLSWAREAEARRLAGESQPVQRRLPEECSQRFVRSGNGWREKPPDPRGPLL